MAAIKPTRSIYPSSKKKLMREKQCRRKTSLMRKASEYSKMCDADVCLGIRIRETGQVHLLFADASGFWAFLTSQLVCGRVFRQGKKADLLGLPLPNAKVDYRPRPGDKGEHNCHNRAMRISKLKYCGPAYLYICHQSSFSPLYSIKYLGRRDCGMILILYMQCQNVP